MKRFKIFYAIVIIISIVMIFTKGFDANVFIFSYDDADSGIVDGFQGDVWLSIINCFIIAIIIILTIFITFNKNNKINIKWILCIATILLALYIHIGIDFYSGGMAGILDGKEHIFLWDLVFYINR